MMWSIAPVLGQMATIFWLSFVAIARMSLASCSATPHTSETSTLAAAPRPTFLKLLSPMITVISGTGACALASTPSTPAERHPAATASPSVRMNLILIMIATLQSPVILHAADNLSFYLSLLASSQRDAGIGRDRGKNRLAIA